MVRLEFHPEADREVNTVIRILAQTCEVVAASLMDVGNDQRLNLLQGLAPSCSSIFTALVFFGSSWSDFL